jgi:hypothetical protein
VSYAKIGADVGLTGVEYHNRDFKLGSHVGAKAKIKQECNPLEWLELD